MKIFIMLLFLPAILCADIINEDGRWIETGDGHVKGYALVEPSESYLQKLEQRRIEAEEAELNKPKSELELLKEQVEGLKLEVEKLKK